MPKANHGLVMPGEPQPIEIKRRSLTGMISFLRPRLTYNDLQTELFYSQIEEKAEQLEQRLNDLHDAVEYAVEQLNERAEKFTYDGKGEDHIEVALARLNRVL